MIALDKVAKKFDGPFVVSGITITIEEGEIVGLLGPNGAGKTTTLRMIAGVLPPSLGTVTINGKNIIKEDQEAKRHIGFLPENNPLYDELTVEEHLTFWANIKNIPKDQQDEAFRFVTKHTGIRDVYYRPIAQLSKGYKQRVGLSQAILTKPDILILDEPTEGLDPNQRKEIETLIHTLGEKRTVIISSHVLSEIARICNRIIIIHKGQIVADDSPEHLKTHGASTIIEAEIEGKGVRETLAKLPGVKKITNPMTNHYSIETVKKKDMRADVFHTAVAKKWTLLSLTQKEAALEDIFSELTSG